MKVTQTKEEAIEKAINKIRDALKQGHCGSFSDFKSARRVTVNLPTRDRLYVFKYKGEN